jgi:transposase
MIFEFGVDDLVIKTPSMANQPILMNELKQVLLLHQSKVPIRAIWRQTGVSRNTIRGYLVRFAESGLSYDEVQSLEGPELASKLCGPQSSDRERYDQFLTRVEGYLEELAKHKHLTKALLWEEEFRSGGTGYRYSQFCYHLAQYSKGKQGSMVMTHVAGEKMYVDFAGDKLHITDIDTGKLTPCEVLITTLGYSNFTTVVAVPTQGVDHVIEGLVMSFERVGKVAKYLVVDNFKSAIVKPDRYEPRINERFLDMANYYGMGVIAARVRKPKDKAKVEGSVHHVYQQIYGRLRHQKFYSIHELNECLRALSQEFNDRIMKDYGVSRRTLLENEEDKCLQDIPLEPYRIVHMSKLKVHPNGHVKIKKLERHYSVPYRLIGQQVTVLTCPKLVKIYHQGECVATHSIGSGRYQTNSDHLASSHRAFLESVNPTKLMEQAHRIDPTVKLVVSEILRRSRFPEHAYKSCLGVLVMEKKVGREKLIESCQIAIEADLLSYKFIKNLCESLHSRMIPACENTEAKLPQHENIRGGYA